MTGHHRMPAQDWRQRFNVDADARVVANLWSFATLAVASQEARLLLNNTMKLAALCALAAASLSTAHDAPAQATHAARADATAAVENTMAQRMQACVVCHGKEGRATNAGYFPRIAGKPLGYIYNQL